jgi:uncharacterized protein
MKQKYTPDTLIKSLQPSLHEGTYVFCSVKEMPAIGLDDAVCFFREKEGITLILKREIADKAGLPYTFLASWITITVQSSLQSIGLTAIFSDALANAGISCNVVAGCHHDHIFVPKDKAAEAMKILNRLSWDHWKK